MQPSWDYPSFETVSVLSIPLLLGPQEGHGIETNTSEVFSDLLKVTQL